jgi:hypothetical protein
MAKNKELGKRDLKGYFGMMPFEKKKKKKYKL